MNILPLYELAFKDVFLMFLLFSFTGWCMEVLYVGIFFQHKFVNRGFLHGPICPIYGFGGLVIMLLPPELYPTWVPLFFASMVLCTAVEYFASWVLEVLFHTKWWDYSHYKCNIRGRVCLLNSVLFGAAGVLGVHFLIPPVQQVVLGLGDFWSRLLAKVLGLLFFVDLINTVRRLVDFSTKMERIKIFAEGLRDQFGHETWFKNGNISEMLESVKVHLDEKKDQKKEKLLLHIENIHKIHKGNVEGLMNRFPTMKSKNYKEELDLIRQKLKERHK